MEIPKGLKAEENECLLLKKTIYGLVQSARKFNRKLVSALKECSFKGNSVDPCLWTKSNHGIVLLGVYVDDCLVIGSNEGIDEVINGLKIHKFRLKFEEFLSD